MRIAAAQVAPELLNRPAETGRLRILTPEDLQKGLDLLVRTHQHASFSSEIDALAAPPDQKRRLPASSPLLNLKPFLDECLRIRVGGRLHHAALSYDEKHPFIITKGHLARLLVQDAHQRTMHGGTQSTLNCVSSRFWVLSGRSYVRSIIRKCTTCARFRGQVAQQQMGQLPSPRVKPQRPFLRSGVDFAGPILVKLSGVRGVKTQKGYICVFFLSRHQGGSPRGRR